MISIDNKSCFSTAYSGMSKPGLRI